jgi:hypothetical protein
MQAMRRRCRDIAVVEHSLDAQARKYMGLYESLLDSGGT